MEKNNFRISILYFLFRKNINLPNFDNYLLLFDKLIYFCTSFNNKNWSNYETDNFQKHQNGLHHRLSFMWHLGIGDAGAFPYDELSPEKRFLRQNDRLAYNGLGYAHYGKNRLFHHLFNQYPCHDWTVRENPVQHSERHQRGRGFPEKQCEAVLLAGACRFHLHGRQQEFHFFTLWCL